jgi:uncharacterized protein (DUF1800 family)
MNIKRLKKLKLLFSFNSFSFNFIIEHMQVYTGPWTKAEAAHLLRRTTFGATNQQILSAVSNGMNATVSSILQIPISGEPLAYDAGETIVPQGSSWVNAVYPANQIQNQQTENARFKSLGAWITKNMNQEQLCIAEKMAFFWQNHFGVTATAEARAMYHFIDLLRQNSLGNFKQLIKDVTVHPAMLLFLNGATNNVFSPNENYSRELLELFSIGKGNQIAAGDYSTYTETDVAAGAKILTGYTVTGIRSSTETQATAIFNPILHDNTSKTLSYHFNSQVLPAAGATEYANYIDVIFAQPQVAKYICAKLYRYFVNYDITSTIQTDVIDVLAQTFINSNFEILPVMQQLLTSDHFYDMSIRGAIIRNPLEMMMGVLNPTQTIPNFGLVGDYQTYISMYYVADTMGQSYIVPPSVAGWTAYYQAPAYSKLWINSTYIKKRFDIVSALVYTGVPIGTNVLKINHLGFLNGLSDPSNAPQVIDDICDVFFPKAIDAMDKMTLKLILTGGLPDFEWTIQYTDYSNDPTNTVVSNPVMQRMQALMNVILKMPQFQTI